MRHYRVKFVNKPAESVDAYAETFGGTWKTSVDGVAFLRIAEDDAEAVENEFERDDNVVEYKEV